jgi:hypothetical protein
MELLVPLDFVVKTVSIYHQGKCVEKRLICVIFQSGAMELPISAQMMYMWKMEFLVLTQPTALEGNVMTAMNFAGRFLDKKQRVQIRIATNESTPKVLVLATVVYKALHIKNVMMQMSCVGEFSVIM